MTLTARTFRSSLSTSCRSRSLQQRAHARRHVSSALPFRVSEEVQQAISERKPVVALESTIYTHGFSYPDNLHLATHLETLVRINGGVPATIGILDGTPRVGLSAAELVQLISAAGQTNIMKVSRRDLAFATALKDIDGRAYNGGTTVSGTMVLAHLAGIKVFATGGLGGVHRGAELTMDVSADLTELGRTPVAVISSGCKSFLDIPKTLEYLETQGVAVATFADGRKGRIDFPAFYTRESGVQSPIVLQNEATAAEVIHASHALSLQSGMLFANPIPEQHSIPFLKMEAAIMTAIQEAEAAGASGAKSTPFILAKIKELTGSQSVEANKALVQNNVVVGTKVAVALAQLEANSPQPVRLNAGSAARMYESVDSDNSAEESEINVRPSEQDQASRNHVQASPRIFVAGSLAMDLACDFQPRLATNTLKPEMHTSNPAKITQSLGGVGHNVARAAHLMGASVQLCSAVGDDLTGKAALEALKSNGMSDSGIIILPKETGARTAQYVAVNDSKKDLVLAMADMSVLDDASLEATFNQRWLAAVQQHKPSHLVVDANWTAKHLANWFRAADSVQATVLFEPVSTSKGKKVFQLSKADQLAVHPQPSIHIATPNIYELRSMHETAASTGLLATDEWWAVVNAFGIPDTGARVKLTMATNSELVDQGIPQQTLQLLPFIPTMCVKLGAQGVLLTQILPAGDERLSDRAYAPFILSRCPNEDGAGVNLGGVYMRLFPPADEVREEEICSVNGVGDTFAGTLVAKLAQYGKGARIENFIDVAQQAAVLTLKSSEAVSPALRKLSDAV